jgi:peptidoglycan endopeptidase LytF
LEDKEKLSAEQVQPEAQTDQEAAQVCGPNTIPYIVRPGDTMFSIARQFGVSLDALIAANPQIPDPSQLRPGQIVCIPQQPVVCPPDTFRYTVQPGDSMFSIAQRFGIPLAQLIAANPQIPDPSRIVPGQIVCVPNFPCPANTFSYTVRQGDTMFSIAQQFGVSLQALIAANPQVQNPNQLYPGQNICVPRTTPPPQQCPPGTFAYTVQPGDSMFLIAQRFGVSLEALIAANPQIPNPNLIFPGQIVCVPRTGDGCPLGTFAYTVQPGDSMFLIAQRFGVSLNALIQANPQIPNPNLIFPGQIVCVPITSKTPRCPAGTFAYTVQSGDTMFNIARRFGVSLDDLIRANPQIPNPNLIKPGQIVCVPTS